MSRTAPPSEPGPTLLTLERERYLWIQQVMRRRRERWLSLTPEQKKAEYKRLYPPAPKWERPG